MAYNVFKRPMFKRGGSTTGTGIMSHVEPRVKAATGFPNFGLPRQPDQSEIEAFKLANQQRIENIRNQPSFFLGPRFTDPNYQSPFKNFFSTNTGFGFMNFGPKTYGTGITANITGTGTGSGDTGMAVDTGSFDTEDANIKANQAAIDAINKAANDNENKDTGEKDKPTYKASNIEDEVVKESELLRKLLKDENYSKGELALVIAGALKEPGGIAAKLDKARELSLPIARKRREEDKAITLAAYKLAKEKEQQQIKAGTLPKELMYLQEQAKLLAKEKGTTQAEEYKNLILQDATLDLATKQSVQTLLSQAGQGEVNRIVDDIKDARQRRAEAVSNKKDTKKIDKELAGLMSRFETIRSTKGFDIAYPQYKNFKEGGRVNRAMGSDEDGETSDIISSQVSFTPETTTKDSISDETVVEKPVENLTFAELRDRLPPEITDDVVQMLSSSEEALQDFAYIRTQNDVNNFNVKYGVNLVIPPTQA